MFWTAFIWGLGASFGGTVGLLSFFVCFWLLEVLAGKSATKASYHEISKASLAALTTRNELTEEANQRLMRIANAIEHAAKLSD